MGGSRRRLKRNAPKVKVGVVKRKKNSKAQVPVELLEQRQDLEKRLNTRWAAAAATDVSASAVIIAKLLARKNDLNTVMSQVQLSRLNSLAISCELLAFEVSSLTVVTVFHSSTQLLRASVTRPPCVFKLALLIAST